MGFNNYTYFLISILILKFYINFTKHIFEILHSIFKIKYVIEIFKEACET